MSYKVNEQEPEKVKRVKLALRERTLKWGQPYCPCTLERSVNTICPCKEFREDDTMKKCHCGLYIREE